MLICRIMRDKIYQIVRDILDATIFARQNVSKM